eukprot:5561030-Pyramimonas_sp.AAC.1
MSPAAGRISSPTPCSYYISFQPAGWPPSRCWHSSTISCEAGKRLGRAPALAPHCAHQPLLTGRRNWRERGLS